ncbi:bifunctional salicylyl-CoA 5-hydroxylase/oxidoreductase [Actinomycetospora straminea]|uniref:Bifunctional salicylyl-CoA 5-hydroxylase/oxidoreductase n=1 Tax=Actinomycetospora straminea TaxID=663607 RepID=A0ABP9EKT6_9PSEU|nr:bifunctional salicylyl-CoA 5-hydroxylase/oxidoreductase [Actinomycetospora straminea]MDD7933291.1 bifunctional salicylyl-CoA 5-hydroxylase/oxidoreductase [Actinomycetospora straminea]
MSTAHRIASIGGGPGGLFTAILAKASHPEREITVHERNAADDTFGFGVVFSEETLQNIADADPTSIERIQAEFRHWSAIDVDFLGTVERSDGHAFAALERKRLLQILGERAAELGVDVRYSTEAPPLDELCREYDVVLAADGLNSRTREALADAFVPSREGRTAKYAWFATERPFDCFTFLIVETGFGLFWAHIYPFDEHRSTFIVETDEATWRRAGLDVHAAVERRPGENDEASMRFCEEIFAEHLQGYGLIGNNSGWLSFTVMRNEHWSAGKVVLVGDAAHTAHFSIGSGTKLALEDAIALAGALDRENDVDAALKAYAEERKPLVASLQRSAQTSLEWFEGLARYRHLAPPQFVFQLLTRSQRVTYDNLRLRDAAYVGRLDRWLAEQTRAQGLEVADGTPPMFHPFRLRGRTFGNRIVVSPMAQYSAVDGVPTDWHLVHLGSRAVGGAGLVMTEMTCVTPRGRITHGCPGLWNDEQTQAWRRIVDFVHRETPALIGAQIGHSGRKGSTKVMWEGMDDPLPDDEAWEVLGPSPIPYRSDSPVPREMTRADIEAVTAAHVDSARRAAEAGFDLLELHYAHGYLVSSFLSPLSNRRTDSYGGSLENRARLGLEILDAVRAVWPEDRPISVRISATDWVDGREGVGPGFCGDDAVALAPMLAAHGADIVDVSTGQTSTDADPQYGRLYQTPFADRIRQETGVPTITVGAVASVEDANTIVAAGRADLCAIARPHLVDPYWTWNAALDQDFRGAPVPKQYRSGLSARRREQTP